MATCTANDVARWMLAEFSKEGILFQEEAVGCIEVLFGEPHFYVNDNGNLAISKAVLKEFKRLTPHAVWERDDKYWRLREADDGDARQSL